MNKIKIYYLLIAILAANFSGLGIVQALTYQEIIVGQTGGRVLGSTTPIYVQSARIMDRWSPGVTTSVAFSGQNVTSGNLISVIAFWSSSTATVSISDNCGNTYALVGSPVTGNGYSVQGAYAKNAIGGSKCQVTMNTSASVQMRFLIIKEISGVDTTSPLDGNGGRYVSWAGAGVDSVSSGTFAAGNSGDFIDGAMASALGNGAAISAGTNFMLREFDNSGSQELTSQDRVQPLAGNSTVTFTPSIGTDGLTFGMAFKPAAADIPPPPDTAAPSTPTNLSASTISSSAINLSWTASTDNVGVTGYKIYRDGSQVSTVTGQLSFSDTGLSASTTYSYTISAYDAAGNNSSQSSAASAVTQAGQALDTTAPSVPTSLSATAMSSSAINLSWTASTDAVGVTGYKVYRSGTQIGTTVSNSYSDSGLNPSTSYTYTVAAYDAAGNNSAQSSSASAATQAVIPPPTSSELIDPVRKIDWSNAGILGGVPNRTNICATLNPGATVAQISSAITNCASGGVVFLNAGTYNLTGGISISKSDVTLRGAGPDQTKLVFSGTVGCGNTTSDICINGGGQWSGAPNNLTSWTAGYSKGTNVITLASTANLSVGKVIILDQLDDASDTGNIYICGTTACSTEGQAGAGGRGGNHAQMQFAEVVAINGSQVTISPGLYMPNWRSSQSPSVWWSNTLAKNVGIEDLTIDNRAGGAGSNTLFSNSYKSWMKNISSIGGGSRSHVDMQYSSNIVVRDSYFWGASGANLSYGVETWMSGNNLVENNIFQHVTSPMLVGPTQGTVWAYNYAIDQYSTNASWLYPSGMEHDVGTSMNLFEGNVAASMMEDDIHGTHAMNTFFRNRLSGKDPAGSHSNQTVPFLFQVFSRYANIVGNVLGTSGYHSNYQAVAGGSTAGCNTSIYNLGFSGTVCGAGSLGSDPLVISTMLRWGNYDTVSNSARWDITEVPFGIAQYPNLVPSTQVLPASLYLNNKPSWWGAQPWPAIGPDVTGGNISGVAGHAYKIPAQLCYENTSQIGGILNFNASSCYSSGGAATPVPGDLNLDHIVNSLDFSLLNSKWNQNYSAYDLNSDGFINSFDYAVLKNNWGKTW